MNNIINLSDFQRAVAVVGQAIAEQNIPVTFGGVTAQTFYIKGKVSSIILPQIVDSDSEELKNATHGYLDHECGHVLYTSGDELFSKEKEFSEKYGEGFCKSIAPLVNLFEDARIEELMKGRYKGTTHNFESVLSYLFSRADSTISKVIEEVESVDPEALEKIKGGVYAPYYVRYLRGDKFCTELVKKYPEKFKNIAKRWGGDKKPFIDRMAKATSIAEIYDIVREMLDPPEKTEEEMCMKGEGTESEKESGDSKNSETSTTKVTISIPSEGDEDGKENGGGEGEDDKKEEGEEKKEEGSEGSEGGESDEKEKDEEDEKEGESEGAGDSKKEELDEKEEKEEGSETKEEDAEKKAKEVEIKISELGIPELKDLQETLRVEIEKMIKARWHDGEISDYVPLSTQWDKIEKLDHTSLKVQNFVRKNPEELKQFLENCSTYSSVIQKQFERFLFAKSASLWEYGQKSGRLYGGGLNRLVFGDERVFRKKIVSNTKDVAISLLIDCSGSMHGSKIKYACMSAYIFALALSKMNLNFEILGFTTFERCDSAKDTQLLKRMLREAEEKGQPPARWEPLNMPIFKEFGGNFSHKTAQALAYLSSHSGRYLLHNNIDGECILIAGKRLRAQPETRKLLIVFSDGMPCWAGGYYWESAHLKQSLAEIKKWGIETFGLGIDTRTVSEFYKDYVVINNLEDLGKEVLTKLKSFLFK